MIRLAIRVLVVCLAVYAALSLYHRLAPDVAQVAHQSSVQTVRRDLAGLSSRLHAPKPPG